MEQSAGMAAALRPSAGTMFTYPKQAEVNRPVPKNKIYGYAKPSRAIRSRFVSQVSEIVWKYKLAPETVNLPAKLAVHEIQVFEVALKTGELAEDVLRTMDKAIPSLLLFELTYEGRVKFAAAYKRPNEANSRKNVVEAYFETPWQPADQARPPLPVALDLAGLYEQILHRHMVASPLALVPRPGESLQTLADRASLIRSKESDCRQLEARIKKEIQFNRKVELNTALRAHRAELVQLQQLL
jgi:hypothetical protein